MTVVDARTNLWETLLGRAPDWPLPADADLWQAVNERLNPARARPALRSGVEQVTLEAARGDAYVMLRSPDPRNAAYVRLTPEEAALVAKMDGTRTVARLVGEFARLSGRLAPDQVTRVVADLAGAGMLEELPVDAYRPLARLGRQPLRRRALRSLIAVAGGRRMVIANPDRVVAATYRFGGRLLFTRVGVGAMVLVSMAGFAVWIQSWVGGGRQAMVAGGSYGLGALILLGLNVAGLAFHEAGHALAAKHAGRRVPAVGVMLYFGIPSAYVDTTDVWMATRRQRLMTTGAGPGFAITFAGAAQLAGIFHPGVAALAFPLGFAWYLNSLFNLNPLMALDGYYLVMDWLEVPNLRPRAVEFLVSVVRRPRMMFERRTGEAALISRYAVLALLWLVIFAAVMTRTYRDRFSGLWIGLGHGGLASMALFAAVVALVLAPLTFALIRAVRRRAARGLDQLRERRDVNDEPRRLDTLRASSLATLTPAQLEALARGARWVRPRRGSEVVPAGAPVTDVFVVVDGALVGRREHDPEGHVRTRASVGETVGSVNVLGGLASSLRWTAAGTTLLAIPGGDFRQVVGPLPGAAPETEGEIDDLFETSPYLRHLGAEEKAAIHASMKPADAGAGRTFELRGEWVAVVGSGVVRTSDGTEVRRGELIGPADAGDVIRAETRTTARLWTFPFTGMLAAAPGAPGTAGIPMGAWASGNRAPSSGMHGDEHGTALAPPPGSPPPPTEDTDADERMRRAFGWLLFVLLLLALVCVWTAWRPGLAWAEIPEDSAILDVQAGNVEAVLGGSMVRLDRGTRMLVRAGDEVVVGDRSLARIVLRGGANVVLCAGVEVDVGHVGSVGFDLVDPSLGLILHQGVAVVDGRSTTQVFGAASVSVRRPDGTVVSTPDGGRFATGDSVMAIVLAETVLADGSPLSANAVELACPHGEGEGDPEAPDATVPRVVPTTTGADTNTPPETGSPDTVPSDTVTPNTVTPDTAPDTVLTMPTLPPATVGGPGPTSPPPTQVPPPPTVPPSATTAPPAGTIPPPPPPPLATTVPPVETTVRPVPTTEPPMPTTTAREIPTTTTVRLSPTTTTTRAGSEP